MDAAVRDPTWTDALGALLALNGRRVAVSVQGRHAGPITTLTVEPRG